MAARRAGVDRVDRLAEALVVHAGVAIPSDRRVGVDLLDRHVDGRVSGAEDQVAHPDDRRLRYRPGAEPILQLRAELIRHGSHPRVSPGVELHTIRW